MPKKHIVGIGKSVRALSRLRGGGSALPGLVVEKLDKNFLITALSELTYGVVIISGTNGKTTTTKMVVELLKAQGLRVFTNPTGSNFKRGVISAILGALPLTGKLEADIAVLELDEAHAVHFIKEVPPRYTLLLNVMRDQLDRFGEIDKTASLLQTIAQATTKGVVLNREDKRLYQIGQDLDNKQVRYFGLNLKLRSHFPNDDSLYRTAPTESLVPGDKSDVVLESFEKQAATFSYNNQSLTARLKIKGMYNLLNAAAAIALARLITGDTLDETVLVTTLESIKPAFGRGETIEVNEQPLELVLVKNPSGFRLSLQSYDHNGYQTMIAINDNYADGRDMSWLWDVDFSTLQPTGVSVVGGIRAFDMALRLQYDEVRVQRIEENIKKALKKFIQENKDNKKRIYCTYTAMLHVRAELKKYSDVERVL